MFLVLLERLAPARRAVLVVAAVAPRTTAHPAPAAEARPFAVGDDLQENASSVWSKGGNVYLHYFVGWSPMVVYCCPARLA